MRILITADLHYDMARSRSGTEKLARKVLRLGGDALVLLGDTAGADLQYHRQCLALFDDFPGQKLLVPGNHCLWCRKEDDSLTRYERILPDLAAEAGFHMLDHEPVILEGVGLAGSIGWYDYSFRDRSLDIPPAFYRAKVAPGAAGRLRRYQHLITEHADELTERQLAITARWMDGVHVRLEMTDERFAEILCDKLARRLDNLAGRCDRIVVFLHHLPFKQLVPEDRPDRFTFAAAFLGSSCLGEVLLHRDKVTDVYCGHSHWPAHHTIGHLEVINVGSTYTHKRLEVLEI